MPYSTDTMDSGVPGYGYTDEGDIERIVKEVLKDFKVCFVPQVCCYRLMAVTTTDPICTASPIFLISQLTSLLPFPTLHRIAGMEPTPFAPSAHPVSPQHTARGIFRRQVFSTCPSSCTSVTHCQLTISLANSRYIT